MMENCILKLVTLFNNQNSFVLFLVLLFSGNTFSQYESIKNVTGYWKEPNSWKNLDVPKYSVIGTDVNIYGELYSSFCLDFNLNTLIIYDTLVINGNLELKNSSRLLVNENGVLIVLGDYKSKNKVDVINNGTMIVAGRFEMQGSNNQGSFNNGGLLYLFDTIPAIKEEQNYIGISCFSNQFNQDSCGYLGKSDFEKSSIFSYYSNLPFNTTGISIKENTCSFVEIEIDKVNFCVDERFDIRVRVEGIENPENIIWNFGLDATPNKAFGIGPHNVYYKSSGIKTIVAKDSLHSKNNQDINIEIHEPPVNNFMLNTYNPDSLCSKEFVSIDVVGGIHSLYHWLIPSLNIDTIGNNSINVKWDTLVGEQLIMVSEFSAHFCESDYVEKLIFVTNCEAELAENPLGENYAFTPNGDGKNDYWIIKGIENYPLALIKVFDRNGALVFSSSGYYQNDWDGSIDGRILDLNSYFYIIDYSAYQKSIVRGVLTILHK